MDGDDSTLDAAQQPTQPAEVSQDWLDQQPPSPDDERGPIRGAAAADAAAEAAARSDFDAQAAAAATVRHELAGAGAHSSGQAVEVQHDPG